MIRGNNINITDNLMLYIVDEELKNNKLEVINIMLCQFHVLNCEMMDFMGDFISKEEKRNIWKMIKSCKIPKDKIFMLAGIKIKVHGAMGDFDAGK